MYPFNQSIKSLNNLKYLSSKQNNNKFIFKISPHNRKDKYCQKYKVNSNCYFFLLHIMSKLIKLLTNILGCLSERRTVPKQRLQHNPLTEYLGELATCGGTLGIYAKDR